MPSPASHPEMPLGGDDRGDDGGHRETQLDGPAWVRRHHPARLAVRGLVEGDQAAVCCHPGEDQDSLEELGNQVE